MKKWIAITLSCALLLSLTACAQNTPTEPTEEPCMHEYTVIETAGIFADKQKISTCTLCGHTESQTLAPATKSIKILAIGNSFSHNTSAVMYELCKNAGAEEIVIACMWIGGASLSTHEICIKNKSAQYEYRKNSGNGFVESKGLTYVDGLQDEKWDFIFINQHSYQAGIWPTFGKSMDLISTTIRANVPATCKLYWLMTWGYDADCQTNRDVFESQYDCSTEKMYEAIRDVAHDHVMPTGYFDGLIPAGTAMQNLRTSWSKDLVTSDGYHASTHGCVTLALTALAAMTDIDVASVTYTPLLSDPGGKALLEIAKEAAINAVGSPKEPTQSAFTQR